MHTLTTGGFTPNANTPDPNFGICLQCAAVDRGRLHLSPIPSRSAICATCFKQYCYDPLNPPSKSELPGRKFVFVDPTPEGFSQLTGFLAQNKLKLIRGLVGLVVFLALMVAGLWVHCLRLFHSMLMSFYRA